MKSKLSPSSYRGQSFYMFGLNDTVKARSIRQPYCLL